MPMLWCPTCTCTNKRSETIISDHNKNAQQKWFLCGKGTCQCNACVQKNCREKRYESSIKVSISCLWLSQSSTQVIMHYHAHKVDPPRRARVDLGLDMHTALIQSWNFPQKTLFRGDFPKFRGFRGNTLIPQKISTATESWIPGVEGQVDMCDVIELHPVDMCVTPHSIAKQAHAKRQQQSLEKKRF